MWINRILVILSFTNLRQKFTISSNDEKDKERVPVYLSFET
jgi:hypothetical protein